MGRAETGWENIISLVGFADAQESDWPRYAHQLATELPGLTGKDADLESIAREFGLMDSDSNTADDFDDVLQRLYDWGDIRERLWISRIHLRSN